MKLCMIGTGYVGLVSGVCFSDLGNDVICVDRDIKKIDNLNNGADLSQIYNVAKEIRGSISKFKIIITKSTVPVTTGDEIEKIINQKLSKKMFSVVSNPEFLREGEAIRDFTYPDRVVIGTDDKKSDKILKNLYSPLTSKGAKYVKTSKITFINELANLCEKIDVNIEDISIGMGLDKRIGGRFLRAGPAYGGSCFPKDTKAIVNTADKFNTDLSVINSVIKSNEKRSSLLLKRVFDILENKIKNKKICFLGVTFKANTDDMRDSSCLSMIPSLVKKGAKINYFDPTGEKSEFKKIKNVNFSNSIVSAIKDSDLIIIHTEWNDFKAINFKKEVKNKKFIIFDMRNIYSSKKMKEQKIKYFAIGC